MAQEEKRGLRKRCGGSGEHMVAQKEMLWLRRRSSDS
jgi:hypothetical protein